MKFLSNTYNPHLPMARRYFNTSYEGHIDLQIGDFEWQEHLKWINENIIGEPMPSDTYTVEQLKEMGMIGIYKKEQ